VNFPVGGASGARLIGSFVDVEITEAMHFTLRGEIVTRDSMVA
jgi:hypothetical protein